MRSRPASARRPDAPLAGDQLVAGRAVSVTRTGCRTPCSPDARGELCEAARRPCGDAAGRGSGRASPAARPPPRARMPRPRVAAGSGTRGRGRGADGARLGSDGHAAAPARLRLARGGGGGCRGCVAAGPQLVGERLVGLGALASPDGTGRSACRGWAPRRAGRCAARSSSKTASPQVAADLVGDLGGEVGPGVEHRQDDARRCEPGLRWSRTRFTVASSWLRPSSA